MNSRFPSGESASALGVIPAGCQGVIETLMVSTCFSSLLSVTPTTYTLFVFDAVTNRRAVHAGPALSLSSSCPAFGRPGSQSMSVVCAPRRTLSRMAPLAVS